MLHVLAAEGGYQQFDARRCRVVLAVFSALTALLAIGAGLYLMRGVLAADQGTPKMIEIANAIQEGALGLPEAPVPDDRSPSSFPSRSSCSSPRRR